MAFLIFLIFLAYGSIYIGAYSALIYKGYENTSAAVVASVWPVAGLILLSRKLFLAIWVW
jgi:hypothetical protein